MFLDTCFKLDMADYLPLFLPPKIPPRSNSPSVHSRVTSWLSDKPSTSSSHIRSAPAHNIKTICNINII